MKHPVGLDTNHSDERLQNLEDQLLELAIDLLQNSDYALRNKNSVGLMFVFHPFVTFYRQKTEEQERRKDCQERSDIVENKGEESDTPSLDK